MRATYAVLGVFACSGSAPPAAKPAPPPPSTLPLPPDAALYSAMTESEKCEAVAERATPCADELLAADMDEARDPEVAAALKASTRDRRSSPRETLAMHRVRCLGTAAYPDAVIACWHAERCEAFAACVIRVERPAGEH